MTARLYSLSLSHPSHAARLMLERKGIEHEVVDTLPGLHPVTVRLHGFRGPTVPALKIDGRRIQGSRAISRALDELQPEPRLLTSPAVEEAAGPRPPSSRCRGGCFAGAPCTNGASGAGSPARSSACRHRRSWPRSTCRSPA